MNLTTKQHRNFFAKVDASDEDGCWNWIAMCDKDGYGRFWVNGKTQYAHRVSYMIHVGMIPDGMLVLHSCDNPCCVCPDHLRTGTDQDNINDKMARGRGKCAAGEANGMAKLTEIEVSAIRSMYEDGGILQRELGEMYGVSPNVISKIVRRKIWKHLLM